MFHIKLVIINPGQKNFKVAFSSANLTTGIVLHHENWHFIEPKLQSYFAQDHLCLKETLITDNLSQAMNKCRNQILYEKEEFMQVFFTPVNGEGGKAFMSIKKAFERSEKVWVAVHHLSHRGILAKMKKFSERIANPDHLRVIADDNLFWVNLANERNIRYVGSNNLLEYERLMSIADNDQVRYFETNGDQNRLHHNKFIIFQFKDGGGAVFAGAGNFTNAGFKANFENFYYIEEPHVVKEFIKQYQYAWNELSTKKERLPQTFRIKVKAEVIEDEGDDSDSSGF